MAMPNNHQRKKDPKIKCEYSGCIVTFGRYADRRRHITEKHGRLIYCCISGCSWTTKRMGRFRTHLENVHHIEASTNRTLSSEFRTATAQPLASSSNYFSTSYANVNTNFVPTPPLIYIDYTFRPQAHHGQSGASELYAAFSDKETPHHEYNLTSDSSVTSRTRIQVAPFRVFRPCRLRRRTSPTTARTSSMGPPLTHQSSAMEPTPHFYSKDQDNSAASMQWMSDSFNVELMASRLSL